MDIILGREYSETPSSDNNIVWKPVATDILITITSIFILWGRIFGLVCLLQVYDSHSSAKMVLIFHLNLCM